MWCREIVTGKPSPLLSSFKLSYYTLLNLMRRMENTGQNMEYVIQHSFQQYQFERTLPEKQVCLDRLSWPLYSALSSAAVLICAGTSMGTAALLDTASPLQTCQSACSLPCKR